MATWNVPLEINNLTARLNANGAGLTNPLTTTLLAGGNSITGVSQLAANAELVALGAGNHFTVTDQSLPPNAFIDCDNAGNLTLSGVVRAPTVTPATDSSTRLATTAFVQAAAAGFGTQTQTTSPVTITAASPSYQVLTGSLAYVVALPDATTLAIGRTYVFNCNTSATAYTTTINGFTGTNLVSNAQSGAAVELILLTNATSAGTWDAHGFLPLGSNFGSSGLVYPGNLTLTGSAAKTIATSGTGSLTLSSASQLLLNSGSTLAITTGGTTGGLIVTTGATTVVLNTGAGPAASTLVLGSALANPSGSNCTLVGIGAGASTSTGAYNSLLGAGAGSSITNGASNTVVGAATASSLSGGSQNTIIGTGAAANLSGSGPGTTGSSNSVVGANAAPSLTTGGSNVCLGLGAGGMLTTGLTNVYIGPSTNASAGGVSNEVVIGSAVTGHGANTVTLGTGSNYLVYGLNNSVSPTSLYQIGGASGVYGGAITYASNTWAPLVSIAAVPPGTYMAYGIVYGTSSGPGFQIFSATAGGIPPGTPAPLPIPPSTTLALQIQPVLTAGINLVLAPSPYFNTFQSAIINVTSAFSTVYLIYGSQYAITANGQAWLQIVRIG